MSPDVDDGKDWIFDTRALVIWGLVAFLVGLIVGELLMLAAVAFGSCW